jgi:hypothetical protein
VHEVEEVREHRGQLEIVALYPFTLLDARV